LRDQAPAQELGQRLRRLLGGVMARVDRAGAHVIARLSADPSERSPAGCPRCRLRDRATALARTGAVELALANLVLAAYMSGVIWLVQVVHYPLFAAVGAPQWTAYEAAHRRRITVVVGPPMLAQPLVAGALLAARPGVAAALNLALTAGLLLVTVVVFGRLHGRLERAWSPAAHRRLLRLNALRAVAWTAQLVLAVALAAGE
jgi:hypothetical protein